MLVLFTDFGIGSPYVGLMKQALLPYAPETPVIDLCHDLPAFDSQAAAYLLPALAQDFPAHCVFVGVVDPGVGSERRGLILQADNHTYVGPDNGLFDRVAARAERVQAWDIFWRPSRPVSASFHGRDIFAPVAAMLAAATAEPDDLGEPIEFTPREWPDDLARIVYCDRYGNAISGLRADSLGRAQLVVKGQRLNRARTFSDVAPGEGFYYENSVGLIEIAVNQGVATRHFGLSAGDTIELDCFQR